MMKHRPNTRGAFTLVEIMIVVAIIGLLAAVAVPNFIKARTRSQQVSCVKNLQQIDGAKELWAIESKKSEGTSLVGSEAAVDAYIKGGSPKCAGGGTYEYNPLGRNPTCTIEGHKM